MPKIDHIALAKKFNKKIGRNLDDSVSFRFLVMDSSTRRLNRIDQIPENGQFSKFLETLSSREKNMLTRPIRMFIRGYPNLRTEKMFISEVCVKHLRQMSIDDLTKIDGIANASAEFLQIAFKKHK